MLRETSVCMFTVPISNGAAASVDSGTTDDTGIGSSCLLLSPSLPNGHSDPEFGNDNPPPIPPKASRRTPAIPPRNASHNIAKIDTCQTPRNRFNSNEDNIFSVDLLLPMSCPCRRVEPFASEVSRPDFHPSRCDPKVTNGPKFGCGSLKLIRSTISRLFKSVSLRETFRKGTIPESDTTMTPKLPPRSLSRNLEMTSLRGLPSIQTLHATYSNDQSSCVNFLRRQTNRQFVPFAVNPATGTVTRHNALSFTGPQVVNSLRRQRPRGKSPQLSTDPRGRKQLRQQCITGDSYSIASTYASASHDSFSSARFSIAAQRAAFTSDVPTCDGGIGHANSTNTNNSNITNTELSPIAAVDLINQTSAISSTNCSSLGQRHGFFSQTMAERLLAPAGTCSDKTVSSTSAGGQPSQPPPVLLHHVHHIHHFHHFHHHHALAETAEGARCPARGPTPLSEEDSNHGSSNGISPGDELVTSRYSTAQSTSTALAPVCAGPATGLIAAGTNTRASGCGVCCCCSYACSPDSLTGGIPMPTGDSGQAVFQPAPPPVTADTRSRQQETDVPAVQPRCFSSSSTTLLSSRGSPGSTTTTACCCCGNSSSTGTGSSPATVGLPGHQRESLPHQHQHRHGHQHHHSHHRQSLHPPLANQHHHPAPAPPTHPHHLQQRPEGHSRSRTAGSSGNSGTTVYCCCGAACGLTGHSCSLSDSWKASAALTPPCLAPASAGQQLRNSACAAHRSRDSPRQSPATGQARPSTVVSVAPLQAAGQLSSAPNASLFSPVTSTATTTTCSSTLMTAELQDRRSSFQRSMLQLRKMGWYWGPLSFEQAQLLLAKRPDGTFLVRDSGHETYILSLSFRVRGETYHTRIEHSQGRFSFWSQPQSHSASTMVEFIEKAVAHSISGQFHYFLQSHAPGQPPVEVPLLYPLSRFQVVASLRHLARFTILSHIRRDHIDQLPLPRGMLHYLSEKQCYVESLEAFEEAIRDRPPLPFHPRLTRAPSAAGPDSLAARLSQSADGPTGRPCT